MGEWNMLELWRSMGTLCHGVVIVLAIMFLRSVGVSASAAALSLGARAIEGIDFRDGKFLS